MWIARRSLLALLLVSTLGWTAWAEEPKFSAPKAFTLALGDSLAFGFQQVKFAADPFNLTQFHTGFAFVFAARVAETPPGKGNALMNLGCPGETSASFLAGPCAYHAAGFPLHVNYGGAQIDAAEAILDVHRGQVNPILIALGANDVLGLVAFCGVDPACIETFLPGVLATLADNYDQVLARLRAAAPDAEIILLQLYNPLAVIDPSTNGPAVLVNDTIADVAAAHRARLANAFPAFNLAPPQPATLCVLTLMCVAGDVHASDAGYEVIADLMFEASGYTRFER